MVYTKSMVNKKREDERGTYFSIVTHNMALGAEIVDVLPDFVSWAYIIHEPDTEEGSKHYHFLVRANGTRSVKQIADKVGIPSNFVQVVRKVVAFRRYMLHLDNDEKITYTLDDIHTNCRIDFVSAIEGNKKKDCNALFRDFKRLSRGIISPEEFVQLNYVELEKMGFYQKIKIFEMITRVHGTT